MIEHSFNLVITFLFNMLKRCFLIFSGLTRKCNIQIVFTSRNRQECYILRSTERVDKLAIRMVAPATMQATKEFCLMKNVGCCVHVVHLLPRCIQILLLNLSQKNNLAATKDTEGIISHIFCSRYVL